VDVTSADALDELDKTLHEAGIELCFAEMKGPVKDKLKRFGLFSRLGEQCFFATLGEAVSSYLESQSVAWVDWEDRVDGGANDSEQKARTAGSIDPPAQAG
jgi:STAS domain